MSREPGKTMVVGQSEVLQPTRGKRAEHLKSQVTLSLRRRKLGDVTRVSNFLGLPSAGAFAWRHRCAATTRQFSRRRSKIASSDTVTNDNG